MQLALCHQALGGFDTQKRILARPSLAEGIPFPLASGDGRGRISSPPSVSKHVEGTWQSPVGRGKSCVFLGDREDGKAKETKSKPSWIRGEKFLKVRAPSDAIRRGRDLSRRRGMPPALLKSSAVRRFARSTRLLLVRPCPTRTNLPQILGGGWTKAQAGHGVGVKYTDLVEEVHKKRGGSHLETIKKGQPDPERAAWQHAGGEGGDEPYLCG